MRIANKVKSNLGLFRSIYAAQKAGMNRKGQISQLPATILSLGLAVLIFGAIMLSLESFTDAMTPNSNAFNATNTSLVAVGTLGTTWMTPIVSVVAAGIMIGVVVGAFAFLRRA